MAPSGGIRTDQVAQPHFAAHGLVDMRGDGNIVRANVTGPFNAELVIAFANAVNELLASWRPTGPYGWYAIWHGSMMTQPDALAIYERLLVRNRHAFPRACINLFCVPPDVEGRRLMVPLWETLYRRVDYPMEIVSTPAEAELRLQYHLDIAQKT